MMNLLSFLITFFLVFTISCASSPRIDPRPHQEEYFWLDTDIGFDVDDFLALILASELFGDRLVGVSTSLYQPIVKAKMTKVILSELGRANIRVSAGLGTSASTLRGFRSSYPYWPPQFGAPYPKQADSIKEVFGEKRLGGALIDSENAIRSLKAAIEKFSGRLTIICVGPLTNLARLLKRSPELSSKIKRVVVMGGWKEKAGAIVRPGYNTLMDLNASNEIFNNENLNIQLVTTNLIRNNDLRLSVSDFEKVKKLKSKIGQSLHKDIKNWMDVIGNKDGRMWLYDPAAVLIASEPEWVSSVENVKISLTHQSGVHMKSKDAHRLIEVQKGSGSLKNFKAITNAKEFRSKITTTIFKALSKRN